MRTQIYSFVELMQISNYSYLQVSCLMKNKSIDEKMKFRRLLQKSLSHYNKRMEINDQMRIIAITMQIERMCRPVIKKHFINLLLVKYPELKHNARRLDLLSNDKTEKTIKKYSF